MSYLNELFWNNVTQVQKARINRYIRSYNSQMEYTLLLKNNTHMRGATSFGPMANEGSFFERRFGRYRGYEKAGVTSDNNSKTSIKNDNKKISYKYIKNHINISSIFTAIGEYITNDADALTTFILDLLISQLSLNTTQMAIKLCGYLATIIIRFCRSLKKH